MSKIPEGVRLAPPLLLYTWNSNHDYCEQIKWPKKEEKNVVDGVRTRDPSDSLVKNL